MKNGEVMLENGRMDYIRFGSGPETLILLPGLGDGLRTVKGTALPMALMYRKFAKRYTVYAFSRRDGLQPGVSTRDMTRAIPLALTGNRTRIRTLAMKHALNALRREASKA